LEVILWIKSRVIGTLARTGVKQGEIDWAAVPQAVQDTNDFSHAYDNIEEQVDDTGEVTGQFAIGWHVGQTGDEPPAARQNQAA
jgi:hypothetical protein